MFLVIKYLGFSLRNKAFRINDLTKQHPEFRNEIALCNESGQKLTNTCDEASPPNWLIFDQCIFIS
jgi:hypothetical protein